MKGTLYFGGLLFGENTVLMVLTWWDRWDLGGGRSIRGRSQGESRLRGVDRLGWQRRGATSGHHSARRGGENVTSRVLVAGRNGAVRLLAAEGIGRVLD